MMWLKWFPWKFIVRRVARAQGFLDPIALLARLRRFAQPSEVHEPIELLRAGVVLHARGLINSRVLQHNLDWVWPYWVERQFDPKDDAFVPRAFSITHINLTHRNWTAIGLPDYPELPIVDPRGLLTPFFDGWSLDGWILTEDGRFLLPSRSASSVQRLYLGESLAVKTETHQDNLSLITHAEVQLEADTPACRMRLKACADTKAWAIVALRPYNPEGVSFIYEVALSPDRTTWAIDGRRTVEFSAPADRHHVSRYRTGDVYFHFRDLTEENHIKCDAGMATAAALFKLEPDKPRDIVVSVPLESGKSTTHLTSASWHEIMRNRCELHIPDEYFQFLYDVALRTLVLNSPGDVYPGPFTYKRFWFRDAAFIIHALLCAGFIERAERALDRFPARQNAFGFFCSQDGEWDSNGEALWIISRFCQLAGRPPKDNWWKSIRRGARWISKKRLSDDHNSLHSGLLPAGFSAEHLGPNDYYYWDDFWGVSGLRAAAYLAGSIGDNKAKEEFLDEADAFSAALDHSMSKVSKRLGRPAMPASPYRRLDSGAIGSLAAGYPLRLFPPDDTRLLDTVDFILTNCFVDGGFFQEMTHSGINAYLTLHVAQILLRAGNPRYFDLMTSVAELASPTGQWPEAIHPRTRGGCMGDGQHVWAAAEWVLMIRNCFIREEGNSLILASGIPHNWLRGKSTLSFGPAPNSFGTLRLSIKPERDKIAISWQGAWHSEPPVIKVHVPGFAPFIAGPDQNCIELNRGDAL
ncbi:MAG: hypothetical protein JRJ60_12110 [Deltaproteobacteria bacterium]|nr:hypothetical protein [Deltaproteobacteria bacterium]